MSALIERLRKLRHYAAADEIERLQKELDEVNEARQKCHTQHSRTITAWEKDEQKWEASNKMLREALYNVHACFIGAEAEGLLEKLQEANKEPGTLGDLVERRLMYADTYAEAALAHKEEK